MTRLLLLLCVIGACTRPMDGVDEIYAPVDDTRVLCGLGVDSESIMLDDIGAAMERARDQQQVLILFAHEPGKTIGYERVDDILTLADRASLPHVTFPELVDARDHAGVSLGFDDFSIDAWFGLRDILRAHDARVTFFVSNFGELTPEERVMLHELATDGHAIEAHGMGHRNAPQYAETYGLSRYLTDEIDPMLELMEADGFAPTTFAYPYGDRTNELDDALLERFSLVRSLSYLDRSPINSAPCPR